MEPDVLATPSPAIPNEVEQRSAAQRPADGSPMEASDMAATPVRPSPSSLPNVSPTNGSQTHGTVSNGAQLRGARSNVSPTNGTLTHGTVPNGAHLQGAHLEGVHLKGPRANGLSSVVGYGNGLKARQGWVAGRGTAAWPRGPARLAIVRPAGLYERFGKRALDLLGATLGLVIGAPILALAALAIKLESRGPVFYKSTRVGRDGRPFTFYKLRSMVNGADRHRHDLKHLNQADGPVFKIFADPRITRVGRLLRSTSVDELPQLFHVLTGEMSLVGPRPPLPDEVRQYEPWQLHRLDVRPGLTCLWQISGRSRIGFEEWMRLDLEYIRSQSLLLDVKILLRTIPAVLSREGAY